MLKIKIYKYRLYLRHEGAVVHYHHFCNTYLPESLSNDQAKHIKCLQNNDNILSKRNIDTTNYERFY